MKKNNTNQQSFAFMDSLMKDIIKRKKKAKELKLKDYQQKCFLDLIKDIKAESDRRKNHVKK